MLRSLRPLSPSLVSASLPRLGGVRLLSIHEYRSQDLMREYGIDVPNGGAASTPEAAEQLANQIGKGKDYVVKAQVLAGGRGLGHFSNGFQGGVHVCFSPHEARNLAEQMLGQQLITKQTGAEGRPCNEVLVAERLYVRREMYFAIVMDRAARGPCIVASAKGGMDIETVAAEDPDAIIKEPIDIETGPVDGQFLSVAEKLGFSGKTAQTAADNFGRLYKLFIEKDATMVEVNPLAHTPDDRVVCMDAKINFDDNALFRQKEVAAMRDFSQENELEVKAQASDLNYIHLNGSIGCLVNGAGLAMSTMDLIQLHGGKPANFLDVGGGATEQQVTEAFSIIAADPRVEAILVNIFGGIMRCDVIAQGIINACKVLDLRIPLVVRLQGTNVEEAKLLIESNPVRIIAVDDLDEAATKAVNVAHIVRMAKEAEVNVRFQLPM